MPPCPIHTYRDHLRMQQAPVKSAQKPAQAKSPVIRNWFLSAEHARRVVAVDFGQLPHAAQQLSSPQVHQGINTARPTPRPHLPFDERLSPW